MKEATLKIDQNGIFYLACFYTGNIFSEETDANKQLLLLEAIDRLKEHMTEETKIEFKRFMKEFSKKREAFMTKGIEMFQELIDKLDDL